MRTVVINLTRFGDLIQSQSAISGLVEAGERVELVCLENFSEAAGLLDGVERVHGLPGARLLAALDRDWRLAMRELLAWLREVEGDFPPDRIVNLTSSLGARLLTRLAGRPASRPGGGGDWAAGFSLDEFGFGVHDSPWAAFLSASSASRGCSPFNLVDVFKRVAGVSRHGPNRIREPEPEAVQAARARLDEMLPARTDGPEGVVGYVAFQLGASEERRTWPTDFFARLGERLHAEAGLAAVLVGTPSEAELGTRYLEAAVAPCVDLIGRTSLPELAATLAACRLLVTNDTGTMHLAAALGVPVAAVFLATAQPWDTGPYLPGALSLEPDLACHPCGFGQPCAHDSACRRAVTPEAVLHCVLPFLREGAWGRPGPGTRAWVADLEPDGFLTLQSVSGHDATDRALWVKAQRYFYRRFLDGLDPAAWPDDPPAFTPAIRAALAKTLREAEGLLHLLVEQGALLARLPREPLKAKFLATCQRLEAALKDNPGLVLLGHLWAFEAQDMGHDLPAFLAASERYRALVRAMSTLFG